MLVTRSSCTMRGRKGERKRRANRKGILISVSYGVKNFLFLSRRRCARRGRSWSLTPMQSRRRPIPIVVLPSRLVVFFFFLLLLLFWLTEMHRVVHDSLVYVCLFVIFQRHLMRTALFPSCRNVLSRSRRKAERLRGLFFFPSGQE